MNCHTIRLNANNDYVESIQFCFQDYHLSFLSHLINNLMFELVGRGHKREEGAQVSLQRDSPLRGKIQYEC